MKDQDEKAQEIADLLSTYVNGGGSRDAGILAKEILTDHRTLVQLKFKIFLEMVEIMSKQYKEGNYDLRNEDSCRIANEICEAIPNRHVRFI